jgi:hypothetical protein
VLDQEYAGEAELFGLDDVVDEIMVAVAIAGRPATRSRAAKKPKLHRDTSSIFA